MKRFYVHSTERYARVDVILVNPSRFERWLMYLVSAHVLLIRASHGLFLRQSSDAIFRLAKTAGAAVQRDETAEQRPKRFRLVNYTACSL